MPWRAARTTEEIQYATHECVFAELTTRATLLSLVGFLERECCMSKETHLATLEQRHDALDKEISREMLYPAADELKLAELKRKKLQLKDEIEKLRSEPVTASVH
jgi:hypothetical protein